MQLTTLALLRRLVEPHANADTMQSKRFRICSCLLDAQSGQMPLLIATDVAARGLDIDNVEVVINYSFPLVRALCLWSLSLFFHEKTPTYWGGICSRDGHHQLLPPHVGSCPAALQPPAAHSAGLDESPGWFRVCLPPRAVIGDQAQGNDLQKLRSCTQRVLSPTCLCVAADNRGLRAPHRTHRARRQDGCATQRLLSLLSTSFC